MFKSISSLFFFEFFIRLISYSCHIILSYYLVISDYSLIAIISTVNLFICGFKDFGIFQYLLSKKNYNKESYLVLRTTYLLNLSAFIIGLILSVILSLKFSDWRIVPLIVFTNILMPFNTYLAVIKIPFYKKKKFHLIGKINLIANLIAFIGLIVSIVYFEIGVFSYLIYIYLLTFVLILYFYPKRMRISKTNFELATFVNVLKNIKWLIFNKYLTVVSNQGFYLVIVLSISAYELAIFYFGIQLYEVIAIYFTSFLNHILIPIFKGANNKLKKETEIFFLFNKILSLIGGYIVLISILIIPLIVNYFWNSKWNDSIIIFIIIVSAWPIPLINNVLCRNFLEFKGKFKSIFNIKILESSLLILLASVGMFFNGIIGVSIMIFLHKFLFSFYSYYISMKILKFSIYKSILIFFKNNFTTYLIISSIFMLNIDLYKFEINVLDQLKKHFKTYYISHFNLFHN